MGFGDLNWPKRVTLSAALIVVMLGVTALVGWHFHYIALFEILPTLVPTQRMTAVGFVLMGAALFAAVRGQRAVTTICTLVVLVQAILVCLEYSLNISFGIDQLLGPDYINMHTSNLGRMSPVTALCFLGSCAALLAIAKPALFRYAAAACGILASVLSAVSIVSALGILLGHPRAYGWTHLTRMSLHTSAGFAFLGIGLLAWAWQNRLRRSGAPDWLPLSIGIGLAAGALGVYQALIKHQESDMPRLSRMILAGGVVGAFLVAVVTAQAVRARRRSRELQEDKDLLERVLEASPDALLLIDRRGRIVRVNRHVEAMFGYRPDEILKAPIETLVPPKLRKQHRVLRQIYYASPSPRPMGPTLDLRALRKDGSQFPVEISLGPVEAGNETQVLVVVRDITDSRLAQEALRHSEERFRGIFEQSPIGLTLIGPDYRMIRVNGAFCRMLGYSEQELTRMTPLDITHPDDIDGSVNALEQVFGGAANIDRKIEKRYVKKNGEIIWGNLSATVVRDPGGRALYGLGMVEDITERKRVEAELRLGNEIIASIEEGLCLVRASDSTILFVNPKFEKMFGYNPGEMIGKHVAAVNAPTDKSPEEVTERMIARLMRRGVWQGEILNRRKDGTPFFCSVTVSTFDHPGLGKLWVSIHEDVTERKRVERKLRQQAALLDLAPDAVIVRDLDGKIIFWNQGASDTYGWRREEALGRVAHDLWQTRFPFAFQEIKAVVTSQGHWEGELQHSSRDGRTIVVDSRWSLQRGERGKPIAMLEIDRDITQRKRAEEQLRDVTERLSLATRTASIGIWDLDLRTKRAVWDDTSFEIFGMDKVVPMAYADFVRRVHPDDLAGVEASFERAVAGKTQDSVEFRVIRPDGSIRHVSSVEGAVLDEHDNVVRLVGTTVDITERKKMEKQIEASREQVATSARLSALGMMAGGVAHEINNPLAIIHASAADLLRHTKEEGAVSPAIVVRNSQRILETANRITRIIKSMRQLAREGSQDRFRPVSVAKIVEDTLEVCKERFRHHSVQLFAPDVNPGLTVPCREVQVEQVLLNLLQNAFEAVVNQPGEKWIRLEVTEDGGAAMFSVIDSGPGVPSELRNQIMEPFFTTKEVGQGTGLGLSLSRTIIEEHGGKLELTENAGHSCFSFSLALTQKEELVCD